MKRTKDHILLLLLLAAGLLTGCTADDTQTDGDGSEIHFEVTEWQTMSGTRANTMTEGLLATNGSFQVDAFTGTTDTKYIDDKSVIYTSGQWQFAKKIFWPATDLTFVAYMPASLPGNTCITKANPYYSYTDGPSFVCTALPMSNAGQYTLKEFIYAVAKDQNKAGNGATGVTLAFHHTMSKITLHVMKPHRKVTINKITFKNLYNNGTYLHRTATWTPTGSQTNLVITPDPMTDLDANAQELTNISNPLLMLPQSYTAASQIEVKLQYWKMDDSGKEDELTLTFNNPISEWEIGKSYNYTLNLSESHNIRFGVLVTNWNDDGVADNSNFTYDVDLMLTVDNWDRDGVADVVSFSYDADFMLKVDDWDDDGTDNLDYNN